MNLTEVTQLKFTLLYDNNFMLYLFAPQHSPELDNF